MTERIVWTARETGRKVQATVGLYAPSLLGYTRATMVTTMGLQLRKEELILETLSKSRLRVVTHPHDVGIPSNRT